MSRETGDRPRSEEHPAVAAAAALVADVDELSPAEQVARYTRSHEILHQTLIAVDQN